MTPVVSTEQNTGAEPGPQLFTVGRGVNFLLIGDSVSVMKKNFR